MGFCSDEFILFVIRGGKKKQLSTREPGVNRGHRNDTVPETEPREWVKLGFSRERVDLLLLRFF